MIHLVRHGTPQPEPGAPRSQWGLDPSRSHEVETLRVSGALPGSATWYISPERRALETARLLGCRNPHVVDDLREQDRPDTWIDEFHIAVARAFSNPSLPAAPGWEAAAETQRRVASATRAIVDEACGPIVLVGHGTAWVLLVAALTGSQPSIESWRSMTMPDHCVIDNAVILRDWGSWRRP